jgi:hypothetical protein
MAIGITENTGNARIISNNNIRDFIRETREISGKITQTRLDFSPLVLIFITLVKAKRCVSAVNIKNQPV